MFPGADGDALSHSGLRDALFNWSQLAGEYSGERTATLVIYATGHGYALGKDWVLVPPEQEIPANPRNMDPKAVTKPADLIEALHQRGDLAQVLLILDACGAAPGGEQTLLDAIAQAPYRAIDDQLDLWVVAAARRSERALETMFSNAFTTALRDTAAPSRDQRHLDLTQVMESVQNTLRDTSQKARIVAGHGDPRCRALPNPLYMPPEPPNWLPPGWSAASRGVVNEDTPGWYFTGRERALRAVIDHLTGAGSAPPLWLTGSHGSGKTAILARVVSTATVELRAAVPVVARHGVLPADELILAPVDARGRTTDRLAADIARSLELTVDSASGLLTALRRHGSGTVRGVIVDHLDEAREPGSVLAELVEPLTALSNVRVVVGASRQLLDEPPGLIVDLDEPAHHGPSSVGAYLQTRLTYGGRVSTGTAALQQICGGCFAAAVTAADVILRENTDSLQRACEAAADRLDGLLRQTLREFLPQAVADAVADTLTALCSFGDGLFLDLRTWAAVATRLGGTPLSPSELGACLPACRTFLVHRDATGQDQGNVHGGWRPCHPSPANGRGSRRTVLRHLRDELDPARNGWENVPSHLLDILAAAAADPTSGTGHLLDDPDFLLALPRPTMTRTVKALRGPDHAARTAVWNNQPRRGKAHQRRFALALAATRMGLTDLARAVGPVNAPCGSLAVRWANPAVRERHTTTRVSAAGEPGPRSLITAHDDGTLSWWDATSGERSASRSGVGPVSDLHAITASDGAQALLVLSDGSVVRCTPDVDEDQVLRTGSGDLPGPSASHPAGLLALGHGPAVEVLSASGADPVRLEALRQPVVALAMAGRGDDPVVWVATLDGVVHRWCPADDRAAPRRVALCPNPVRLAASADGETAVIVDSAGTCTFVGGAALLAGTVPTLERNLRAVHLTADWFVVAGGDRDGNWLDTHSVTDGSCARWPLDALPAGIRSHGTHGLIVATSRALTLLHAETRQNQNPGMPRQRP
ncbi:ATP-binding protein [Streptomyces sp. HP-A2021]|uniref:ATP-binding protein n=1 Tax=Streptomyces sp. HP-A2021 TaxID=2927875 RepID=UPI001FAE7634|nr:ATP-binding protein [Streptomyces sp. HP-A2021]UOB11880.1 ATP-binding protein [Streptomyces sp. HP-A2021]